MFSASGVSRLMRMVAEEATETMADCVQRLSSPVHTLQGSLYSHKTHSSLSSDDDSSTSSLTKSSTSSSSSSDECFPIDDMTENRNKHSNETCLVLDNLFQNITCIDVAEVSAALSSLNANESILEYEDKDHYNILQKAVILNQKDLFLTLIHHGCDVNFTPPSSCNVSVKCRHRNLGLLHLACLLGRLDLVEILIKQGADLSAKRCVYTSCIINCPADLQPKILSCGLPSAAFELVHRCGAREPAFFAVLGDHRDVLHHIFNIIHPLDDPASNSLLPLACRAGSTRCLEYLIQVFPHMVDCQDADGLPPILMAMKHGLAPLRLLLENGARANVLNNHWKPGNNIFHFLFQSLPFKDVGSESLVEIVGLCLEQDIDLSSIIEDTQQTPLHHLVDAVNIFCTFDKRSPGSNRKDTLLTQAKSDGDIMKCIEYVLNRPDIDINMSDQYGKTLLHILCNNNRHIKRYKLCQSGCLDPAVDQLMKANSFGLDNLVGVIQLILQHGAMPKADCKWSTPLNTLLSTLVTDHPCHGRGVECTTHSLHIITQPDVFRNYQFLVRALVESGNDINSAPSGSLPPLLHTLSLLQQGHVDLEIVSPLHDLMVELLELGAWTEYDSCYDGESLEKRHIGAFDVLLEALCRLKSYPSHVDIPDLRSVVQFTIPLLQFGAKTVVYGNLLYGHSDAGSHPEPAMCHHLPEHSYIYQLLQLGAMNLHITSQATYFWQLCDLLLEESDHTLHYEVLRRLRAQFEVLHDPEMCECGQCDHFGRYLRLNIIAPRSLQNAARKKILKSLKDVCPRFVEKLPLPQPLKQYLLFMK